MHVWDLDGDHHSEQESPYTLLGTLAMCSVYLIVCIMSPSCSQNWPGSSNGWWRTGSRPQSLVRRRRRSVKGCMCRTCTWSHLSSYQPYVGLPVHLPTG